MKRERDAMRPPQSDPRAAMRPPQADARLAPRVPKKASTPKPMVTAQRPKPPQMPTNAPFAKASAAHTVLRSIGPVTLDAEEIILEMPTRPGPAKPAPAAPLPRSTRAADRFIHEIDIPVATPHDPDVCPICLGAGYVRQNVAMGHPLFGKAVPCRCKEEEMEQRRRDELWRLSSLDAFQEMTFETFNHRVPGTREAWEIAQRYGEDPDGWLVLSGPCGSGKTHLAAAIANHQFQQGNLVLFAVVPQLLDHLRAAFAPSSETTYDALFTKVCEAGLLVLDDLGSEHTTPWAQEKLFQIINHRYMYGTPTVITTNLELINDLDDRVRSRLTDVSVVRHVRLGAADYRPHHTPPRKR
jgi:DNA replication protein DnaC